MKIELTFMYWRPKMAIFQFFMPHEKLIEVNFFSHAHQEKIMICDHNI